MSAIFAGIFLPVKGLISDKCMHIDGKEVEKIENNFSIKIRNFFNE
jgi:hypothetical protein